MISFKRRIVKLESQCSEREFDLADITDEELDILLERLYAKPGEEFRSGQSIEGLRADLGPISDEDHQKTIRRIWQQVYELRRERNQ